MSDNILVPKVSLIRKRSLDNKQSLSSVVEDILAAADRGEDCILFPTTLSHDVVKRLREKEFIHQFVIVGCMTKSLVMWN